MTASSWIPRLAKRLAPMVVVVALVTFATSAMTSVTGKSPAALVLPETATGEDIAAFNEKHGYNDPLLERYVHWIGNAFSGDFGTSVRTNESVADLLSTRIPITLELALLSILISLAISVPLGVIMASRAGGRLDRTLMGASAALLSLPTFVVSLVAVLIISVKFQWLPALGWVPFSEDPGENLHHLILPVLVLVLNEIPIFSRLLRNDVIGTLNDDFVLTARTKGLSDRFILFRHALRPSLGSLMMVTGVSFGRLLGGAVIIETFFALPGLGALAATSIFANDFPVIQAIVVLVAVIFVLINALLDLLYPLLDPRQSNRV